MTATAQSLPVDTITVTGEALASILTVLCVEPARLAFAAMHLPPVLARCDVVLIDAPRRRDLCHQCHQVCAQLVAARAGGPLCGYCASDVLAAALDRFPVTCEVYR